MCTVLSFSVRVYDLDKCSRKGCVCVTNLTCLLLPNSHLTRKHAKSTLNHESEGQPKASLYLHSAVTIVKGMNKTKWALVCQQDPQGARKVTAEVNDLLGDETAQTFQYPIFMYGGYVILIS